MKEDPNCILFFDGYCNLCNRLIDFLIKRDHKSKIFYSPLTGDTAKKHLSRELLLKADTVVLYHEGRLYLRSTAALWALSLLGGAWKFVLILFVFPAFVRDPIYNLIARNRYRWFGKRAQCRIPLKDEESQFLD